MTHHLHSRTLLIDLSAVPWAALTRTGDAVQVAE